MALTAYTPTIWVNGATPALNATNLNKMETGIDAVTDESIIHASNIATLKAPVSTKYTPQSTAPTYQEGQVYYDSNYDALVAQNGVSGSPVLLGFANHMHVINNSGAVIEKGMAVRHNGVDVSGNVQIVKAIATSFVNANVLGVAQDDIANGASGHIITFGEIFSVNTSTVATGVPLYLSDTIAGTWTATAPTIITQIGGALTSSATGNLFVSIIANSNLPTVFVGMSGQTTPLYSLTTTSQDIVNFTSKTESVCTAVLSTGIITASNTGIYRSTFSASISFTSTTTTRSITFELYDVISSAILYSFVKNIPRDATDDGVNFTFPSNLDALDQIKMRVKSSTTMDITFNSIVFDVESVSIK